MALTLHAAVGAVVALLFWTVLGLCISQRIFPSALRLPVATAVDDLLVLDGCATEADWAAGVIYIPLR